MHYCDLRSHKHLHYDNYQHSGNQLHSQPRIKRGNNWAIIDRSEELARTGVVDPDVVDEQHNVYISLSS
jgi:hypothetical protein